MRRTRLGLFLPVVLLCTAVAQNSTEGLINEALKPSPIAVNLQRLTDEVGGRVPGTPAMQKAVQWAVDAFKSAGADSVHTEDFTIPFSWAEGATQMRVVAPEEFDARAVSIAWAPALAPQHHVRIVDVGRGASEDFNQAGSLAGAILLVHQGEMHTWADLDAEYTRAPGIIDRALAAKALAIAFQSTRPHDLLYRHANSVEGEIDRMPMVIVAREDASRMARLLASGQSLYADLSIPNQIGGPITTSNVIAEVRGREKPEEFVILGAHLDSWELGTGALDNGCNAALVIDALRAIKAAGGQPRRSIRFILFSGEEEGLLGSWAYVNGHLSEMDKAAGVAIIDTGSGRITGLSLGGRRDLVQRTSLLVAPLKQFGAIKLMTDIESGTDHLDFLLQGVPTFVAYQEEANYLINYHASSDTFDKVDVLQLKKDVAEMAEITFALADASERIGPRLSRAQIEKTMRETHFDDEMKANGMWKDWETRKRGRTQ
ncbi:MAG: M20/M25/M40 family metallo-hydrolase [Acidobacteriia bacterium]|nr:M20/M25/M40 family metallo-hydrolase [Terriglobia bacterium]